MKKTTRKQSKRRPQNANLIPFEKGDPRINRKGVPRDAIEMRHMFRAIAGEIVKLKDEGGRGVEVSRLYARARLLFSDRNWKSFELALKAMYPGLLREEVDVTSGGEKIKGYIGIDPAEWDKRKKDAD